jgi:hypothetical protein
MASVLNELFSTANSEFALRCGSRKSVASTLSTGRTRGDGVCIGPGGRETFGAVPPPVVDDVGSLVAESGRDG